MITMRITITIKAIRRGVPSPTPNPTGRAGNSVAVPSRIPLGAMVVGSVKGAGHVCAIDALQ